LKIPTLKRIARSLRPALVLLAVFITFGFAIIAYQAVRTLQQLTAIEAYHELDHPDAILNQVFQSLVPGGRLVIVDPAKMEHGELLATRVEDELSRHGLEILNGQNQFISQPDGGTWWLIVARKP
jgi:hypothetical protein